MNKPERKGGFTAVAKRLKAVNPTAHPRNHKHLGALDVMMQPEQLDVLRREMTKGDPKRSLGGTAQADNT